MSFTDEIPVVKPSRNAIIIMAIYTSFWVIIGFLIGHFIPF